jgi:hypothetical protein
VRPDWRRVVVYTHRWLGILGCVLFVAWFVSGIVLMYARMPELTSDARRALLPPLDLSSARVPPGAAARAARGAGVSPERLRIGMFRDRPVYHLFAGGRWTTVFADTAQTLDRVPREQALEEVRRFAPDHASTIQYDAHLSDPDQWTFGSRAQMPLHRIAVGDAAGTYYYLSDLTGEPVMKTTGSQRRWAYAGAVIHWLYFTPFRRHGPLWAQSVIWVSLAGCLLCLSGLLWGLWRYAPMPRYRLRRIPSRSPYAGWVRWHHYAGLFFGLTTFTWIFSGLLSMDPWDWHPGNSPTEQQRNALSGGPLRLDALSLDGLRAAITAFTSAKEIGVVQFQGEPFYMADRQLVSAITPERGVFHAFDREAVSAAVRSAMPGAAVEDAVWLDRYDAYYYDRRGELTLPVLRVRYADPHRTWLYADPGRGEIVLKEERLSRVNRWLYHGLHSLDFPFLYYRRPLWDIVVVALSIGGIASSVTIVVPAFRRLRRRWREW